MSAAEFCLCSTHAKLPLNEDLEMTFAAGDSFKPTFTTFLSEGIEHHASMLLLTSGVHAAKNEILHACMFTSQARRRMLSRHAGLQDHPRCVAPTVEYQMSC